MKLTKNKVIEISNSISQLEQLNMLSSLGYVFLRNKRKLKPIVEENDEIVKFLQSEFKKESNFDEDKIEKDKEYSKSVNKDFTKYLNESVKLEDFSKEEVEIDFYTTNEKSLEDQNFNSLLVEPLIGYIILEEDV